MDGERRDGESRRRPWEHEGVRVQNGRLLVAGRDAEALAREHGTPLYVIDVTSVAEQARALRDALARAGLTPRVRLALKAQRAPEVLAALLALGAPGSPGAVGVDVCSPAELEHALQHGFSVEQVSYTGTNLSERDLDVIVPTGVHVNLDLLSQIERYGRRCPGAAVGLRLNPRGGVMRGHAESLYSGGRPTKFGIYEEDLDEAVAVARRHGLTVDTVHVHLANGILTDDLPAYDEALAPVARMAQKLLDAGCPLAEVNAGGGLGTSLHPEDAPLDLDAFAGILAARFGHLGVAVGVEPGEFLTNLSGALLLEVVSVEDRLGVTFVGVDAGWNVMNDHYIFGRRPAAVVAARAAEPCDREVTIAGHINEGNDLFGSDLPLPEVREGEILALASAGGYTPGMWTDHCMRPRATTLYFSERI
jgi:diaminopimelate decarboxylase